MKLFAAANESQSVLRESSRPLLPAPCRVTSSGTEPPVRPGGTYSWYWREPRSTVARPFVAASEQPGVVAAIAGVAPTTAVKPATLASASTVMAGRSRLERNHMALLLHSNVGPHPTWLVKRSASDPYTAAMS